MRETEHERVNILLVDDQPAKLLAYEVILKELGENLVVATSGREALEYLLKNEVAVILVDVCMPELDGFELAAMIRDHPRFQKTAMIFISATSLAAARRLSMIARLAFRRLAKARARSTPPASGETTVTASPSCSCCRM